MRTALASAIASHTSTDASCIFAGQWDQLVFGVRTDLMILPLTERHMDYGMLGFVAWMRADIAVLHPGAFAVVSGIR